MLGSSLQVPVEYVAVCGGSKAGCHVSAACVKDGCDAELVQELTRCTVQVSRQHRVLRSVLCDTAPPNHNNDNNNT